jgi:anhydro-N-acetylmuramic acid kinase
MDTTTLYTIGLMSGTSLDGLDIAYCRFDYTDKWNFELLASHTYPYPSEWKEKLSHLEQKSAWEYAKANVDLGHYFGRKVNEFKQQYRVEKLDFVSSHGHTIFHRPDIGITTQIGDIDSIAAETGHLVVGNFRTFDVALGGQGAPLVPIGDELLFADYDGCLNLGGFSNISFHKNGKRLAFDISPCNMILNLLANQMGMDYDCDGLVAKGGTMIEELFEKLNSLEYYSRKAPKSLGKEWLVEEFLPIIPNNISTADLLHTTTEHIACQIATVINSHRLQSIMITGGGALNTFLIECISRHCPLTKVVIPSAEVINYKEAIIFAFLGVLRISGGNNCLSSVTGAKADNCGGNISGKII